MKKLTPVTLPFGRARLATSPPCSGPARPERRPGAASQRSLQACIASLPLQSSLMSKTYLKSDHFNGGGSMSQQSSLTQSAHSVRQVLTAYNHTQWMMASESASVRWIEYGESCAPYAASGRKREKRNGQRSARWGNGISERANEARRR